MCDILLNLIRICIHVGFIHFKSFEMNETTTGYIEFSVIWYKVFIWCLYSSLFIYFLAAALALFYLRKHRIGRLYSVLIILNGILLPLTLGSISSASIAWIYNTANFEMNEYHAMIWGSGQTVIYAFFVSSMITI